MTDRHALMSIGELGRLVGVSSRTIRYYEELGVLPDPERSPGGMRRYTHEHRFYIEGALALKDLGFTLDEIRLIGRIAMGRSVGARQRTQVARVVHARMEAVEHRIRVLHRLREILHSGEPDDHWQVFAAVLERARSAGGA